MMNRTPLGDSAPCQPESVEMELWPRTDLDMTVGQEHIYENESPVGSDSESYKSVSFELQEVIVHSSSSTYILHNSIAIF